MKQFKQVISRHKSAKTPTSSKATSEQPVSSSTSTSKSPVQKTAAAASTKMSAHPNSPLSGKVAVITGGTKGIGAATATHLVSLGAKVVVNYGRDTAAAEKLVSELGADHAYAV